MFLHISMIKKNEAFPTKDEKKLFLVLSYKNEQYQNIKKKNPSSLGTRIINIWNKKLNFYIRMHQVLIHRFLDFSTTGNRRLLKCLTCAQLLYSARLFKLLLVLLKRFVDCFVFINRDYDHVQILIGMQRYTGNDLKQGKMN